MKKIAWMAGGIVLTTAAFFIPGGTDNIWPEVIWSGIAALAYLLVFTAVWLKQIASPAKRNLVGGTLGVLVLTVSISMLLWSHLSDWQSENLTDIRTTIETGAAARLIKEPLVRTLKDYYDSAEASPDFEELFHARYASRITAGDRLEFGNLDEDRTLYFYLARASSDTLVIIGESGYLEGKKSDFENYSGATGLYQVQGMLTREGVRYEQVN